MPKAMHDALKREARKRGFSKERTKRFVFGTMANRKQLHKKQARRSRAARK